MKVDSKLSTCCPCYPDGLSAWRCDVALVSRVALAHFALAAALVTQAGLSLALVPVLTTVLLDAAGGSTNRSRRC
jgi:hypothetical protein